MDELLSYSLQDLLMFSPRVYYRLIEHYNEAIWPAQLLTVGLGLAILYLLLRQAVSGRRIVPVILGALWIWVAWAFLWERYATINWPVAYVVPFFVLQGLLLIGAGAIGGRLHFPAPLTSVGYGGLALFGAALILYPALAPLMGRSWVAAEIFGLAPDPTALATLAVLALADGWTRWLLMIVPGIWCVLSAATLSALGAGEYFVPTAGALAAIGIAIARARQPTV
jgi:hypothetical protein